MQAQLKGTGYATAASLLALSLTTVVGSSVAPLSRAATAPRRRLSPRKDDLVSQVHERERMLASEGFLPVALAGQRDGRIVPLPGTQWPNMEAATLGRLLAWRGDLASGAAVSMATADRQDAMVARLKAVFEEEGVPSQLVWIAAVESAMDPQAVSPAGARGLFQLMPATAERFGLCTAPVDERSDPIRNARAAARYLRTLRMQFGSWPLAIAAFNAGEGRVERLLHRLDARTFDDIRPYLPAQTRSYVPRVIATVVGMEGGFPDEPDPAFQPFRG